MADPTTKEPTPPLASRPPGPARAHPWLRALAVLALLFIFLLGVHGLGDGFKSLGRDLVDSFFSATENPFTALMAGVLATTLVQSSSVTTALVVGLVAAPDNPLPLANAVPMIMGANIGTTVTNTIVSLGHMARREEFRRAFAVATCHDFFNFMAVAILLPLELATGFLRSLAAAVAGTVTGLGGVQYESPIKGALSSSWGMVRSGVEGIVDSVEVRAVLLFAVAAILILAGLFLLVRVMRSTMHARVERIVSSALGERALVAMGVGLVATVMVQSSSITTALLVPLAGAGVLSLVQAFPITIGANIGTTVTALLAALATTGENAIAGVTIALVHLFFNLCGALLIFPVERIRRIPLAAARWLADTAVRSRRWALAYVVGLFYGLPAIFALIDRLVG